MHTLVHLLLIRLPQRAAQDRPVQQVRLRELGKHFESDESRHLGLRSGSKRDSTISRSLKKDGAYNGEPAPQGNRLQTSRTAVRAPNPNTNSRRTNLQHTRPIPTNKRNSPTRRHGADGKQLHKHTRRTRIRRAVWWVVRRDGLLLSAVRERSTNGSSNVSNMRARCGPMSNQES